MPAITDIESDGRQLISKCGSQVDEGLYESLLTARSAGELASVRDLVTEIRNVDQAEQAEVVAHPVRDRDWLDDALTEATDVLSGGRP